MIEIPLTFLLALAWVESRCDDNAIGKRNEVGRYQITQEYLDDANRFMETSYSLSDMLFEPCATEVVKAYLTHYGAEYERKTGQDATPHILARIHNGGPNGWKKKSTYSYWLKVFDAMRSDSLWAAR